MYLLYCIIYVGFIFFRQDSLWKRGRKKHFLLHMPGVSEVFSQKRYKFISTVLHFCDETTAHQRDHPEYDRIYKIRKLTEYLKDKFRFYYSPDIEISIDEGMIPFHGRWGSKQYHKDKPVKWGVKTWMLCDAKTGYNYNFDIYAGRDSDFDELNNLGLASAVVLKLCQPLYEKGHIIYTDRFYTSPTLLVSLRHVGLSGCGTIMTNRKYFPKEIIKPKKQCKTPGESEYRQCQRTGIVATRWVDKAPIYFLSNAHVAVREGLTVTRTNKTGESLEVPATPTVVEYNKYMGGVDHNDKMTKMDKSRKSYKWYARVDRKCVLWAMYNGYVIYKSFHPSKDYRDFTLDVIHQLIGPGSHKVVEKQKATPAVENIERLDITKPHAPICEPSGSHSFRCKVCEAKFARERRANPGKTRSELAAKSVKTAFLCSYCNVHLCIKQQSTCWADYHNKEEY